MSEDIAKARDSGATLNLGLQVLDEVTPKIMQRFSNAIGKLLNKKQEEQIIEEVKQAMRYVYAHPEKSPELLSRDQYHACLAQ